MPIPIKQWQASVVASGYRFRCPMCGNVAGREDFRVVGAGGDRAARTCIGAYRSAGVGCDFNVSSLYPGALLVEREDGGLVRAMPPELWPVASRPAPIDLIVTRHAALVEFLISRGLATEETPVLDHAGVDDVRGKHVAGVLPHWLSCQTAIYIEVPLDIPKELRGQELTVADIATYADAPRFYLVREVEWS